MIIRSENGKYELRVDKQRRIVYETLIGAINAEEYGKLDNDYRTKVIPYLGKGQWVKCSDARKYVPNTSNSPEAINKHLAYLAQHDFAGGAVLVDSATLKMQVNRAAKGVTEAHYFDSEKEADEWLKSQGY